MSYNSSISLLMGKEGNPELDLEQVEFRKLAETYMLTRSIGGAMSGIHRMPIIMDAMYKLIKSQGDRISELEKSIADVGIDSVEREIPVYSKSELGAMHISKLKHIASNLGIKSFSQSKVSLIDAILMHITIKNSDAD